MQLPESINVTDQQIDISHLSEKQSQYYHDLADELEGKYLELGEGRQIFTLSGPPGSGKSVVSAILNHIYSHDASFTFLNVGLDAFHYPNEKLEKLGLLSVKGKYDTYDIKSLADKLKTFKKGLPVSFPYYSREEHNPIADSLSVSARNILMLLEGQWLLRNEREWEDIRNHSSYNLYVAGADEDMRENVIRRHIAGGRTQEDAISFYAQSDQQNADEVKNNSIEPDKKVLFYKDI